MRFVALAAVGCEERRGTAARADERAHRAGQVVRGGHGGAQLRVEQLDLE
jgi:hypothetical protein